MSNITVPLLVPVQNGDRLITELTFREAEVGDLIDASNITNPMERVVTVMAAVSGTPLAVFRKIKARDLKNLMNEVGNLVGNET